MDPGAERQVVVAPPADIDVPPPARTRRAAFIALILAAEALGYGLAWGAGHFGPLAPLALVGMVAVPAVLILIAADPRLAVAAVFLLFPIGTHNVAGPIDAIEAAILALSGVVLVTRLGAPRTTVPAPTWWLVALFGWTLVSFPFSSDLALAVREEALLLVALVWMAVVIVVCRQVTDVRRALVVFMGVMGVVGTISLTAGANARPLYGGSIVEDRVIGFAGDPNSWATVCMMTTLVGFTLALGGARGRWRVVAAVVALISLGSLILSFSRGGWIGLIAGTIVIAVALPQARRVLLALVLGIIPAAVFLGIFAPNVPQLQVASERFQSIFGEKSPWDYRPDIWAEARKLVVKSPLIGVGPGSFPAVIQRDAWLAQTPIHADHAHNFLLTWAAEDGLPAMALLVGLSVHLGATSRRARLRATRNGRHGDAALLAGLTAALASVAAQGVVDYTLRHSVVRIAVFGILGLLLATIRAEAETAPE